MKIGLWIVVIVIMMVSTVMAVPIEISNGECEYSNNYKNLVDPVSTNVKTVIVVWNMKKDDGIGWSGTGYIETETEWSNPIDSGKSIISQKYTCAPPDGENKCTEAYCTLKINNGQAVEVFGPELELVRTGRFFEDYCEGELPKDHACTGIPQNPLLISNGNPVPCEYGETITTERTTGCNLNNAEREVNVEVTTTYTSGSCTVCGNTNLECGGQEAGEGCDDGNLVNGDGCSAICQLENRGSCTDDADCTSTNSCIRGVCSSGICTYLNDDGKSCNDNNVCTLNDACTGGNCKGNPKNCGDGVHCTVDSCNEVTGACENSPDNSRCDQFDVTGTCTNNPDNNDYTWDTFDSVCLAATDCTKTPVISMCVAPKCGAQCNNPGVGDCSPECKLTSCGNGVPEPPKEQCDDGNEIDTDSCVNCQNAKCGDTFIQEGVEECDDGNNIDNDKCTNSCKKTYCGDETVQAPNGNGQIEECDLGDDNGEIIGDKVKCTVDCKFPVSPSLPSPPGGSTSCGNSIIEIGEQCDDGNEADGDGCSSSCELEFDSRIFADRGTPSDAREQKKLITDLGDEAISTTGGKKLMYLNKDDDLNCELEFNQPSGNTLTVNSVKLKIKKGEGKEIWDLGSISCGSGPNYKCDYKLTKFKLDRVYRILRQDLERQNLICEWDINLEVSDGTGNSASVVTKELPSAMLVERNVKDRNKYGNGEKRVFLVADEDWKQALQAIPMSTWDKDLYDKEDWCIPSLPITFKFDDKDVVLSIDGSWVKAELILDNEKKLYALNENSDLLFFNNDLWDLTDSSPDTFIGRWNQRFREFIFIRKEILENSKEKCIYPLFIYHKEGDKIDENIYPFGGNQEDDDREIDFISTVVGEYAADSVVSIKNFEVGALYIRVLKEFDVEKKILNVNPEWWNEGWAESGLVVISAYDGESGYENGLYGSQLASYYNSPLVFYGLDELDNDRLNKYLKNKFVIVIGNLCSSCLDKISEENVILDYIDNRLTKGNSPNSLNTEEIKGFIDLISNNKVEKKRMILVNPRDIENDFCANLEGRKFNQEYCKTSLMAPFLASSNDYSIRTIDIDPSLGILEIQDLVKEIEDTDYRNEDLLLELAEDVENEVEIKSENAVNARALIQEIFSEDFKPNELILLASGKAIPYRKSEINYFGNEIGENNLDRYYLRTEESGKTDIEYKRIFANTITEVSSEINRKIFGIVNDCNFDEVDKFKAPIEYLKGSILEYKSESLCIALTAEDVGSSVDRSNSFPYAKDLEEFYAESDLKIDDEIDNDMISCAMQKPLFTTAFKLTHGVDPEKPLLKEEIVGIDVTEEHIKVAVAEYYYLMNRLKWGQIAALEGIVSVDELLEDIVDYGDLNIRLSESEFDRFLENTVLIKDVENSLIHLKDVNAPSDGPDLVRLVQETTQVLELISHLENRADEIKSGRAAIEIFDNEVMNLGTTDIAELFLLNIETKNILTKELRDLEEKILTLKSLYPWIEGDEFNAKYKEIVFIPGIGHEICDVECAMVYQFDKNRKSMIIYFEDSQKIIEKLNDPGTKYDDLKEDIKKILEKSPAMPFPLFEVILAKDSLKNVIANDFLKKVENKREFLVHAQAGDKAIKDFVILSTLTVISFGLSKAVIGLNAAAKIRGGIAAARSIKTQRNIATLGVIGTEGYFLFDSSLETYQGCSELLGFWDKPLGDSRLGPTVMSDYRGCVVLFIAGSVDGIFIVPIAAGIISRPLRNLLEEITFSNYVSDIGNSRISFRNGLVVFPEGATNGQILDFVEAYIRATRRDDESFDEFLKRVWDNPDTSGIPAINYDRITDVSGQEIIRFLPGENGFGRGVRQASRIIKDDGMDFPIPVSVIFTPENWNIPGEYDHFLNQITLGIDGIVNPKSVPGIINEVFEHEIVHPKFDNILFQGGNHQFEASLIPSLEDFPFQSIPTTSYIPYQSGFHTSELPAFSRAIEVIINQRTQRALRTLRQKEAGQTIDEGLDDLFELANELEHSFDLNTKIITYDRMLGEISGYSKDASNRILETTDDFISRNKETISLRVGEDIFPEEGIISPDIYKNAKLESDIGEITFRKLEVNENKYAFVDIKRANGERYGIPFIDETDVDEVIRILDGNLEGDDSKEVLLGIIERQVKPQIEKLVESSTFYLENSITYNSLGNNLKRKINRYIEKEQRLLFSVLSRVAPKKARQVREKALASIIDEVLRIRKFNADKIREARNRGFIGPSTLENTVPVKQASRNDVMPSVNRRKVGGAKSFCALRSGGEDKLWGDFTRGGFSINAKFINSIDPDREYSFVISEGSYDKGTKHMLAKHGNLFSHKELIASKGEQASIFIKDIEDLGNGVYLVTVLKQDEIEKILRDIVGSGKMFPLRVDRYREDARLYSFIGFGKLNNIIHKVKIVFNRLDGSPGEFKFHTAFPRYLDYPSFPDVPDIVYNRIETGNYDIFDIEKRQIKVRI